MQLDQVLQSQHAPRQSAVGVGEDDLESAVTSRVKHPFVLGRRFRHSPTRDVVVLEDRDDLQVQPVDYLAAVFLIVAARLDLRRPCRTMSAVEWLLARGPTRGFSCDGWITGRIPHRRRRHHCAPTFVGRLLG